MIRLLALLTVAAAAAVLAPSMAPAAQHGCAPRPPDTARPITHPRWLAGAVVTEYYSTAGVWAAAGDHIVHVDPSQPGRVRRVRLAGTISGLTVGAGSVWVTSIGSERNLLTRLDPKTLSVRARIRTAGADAVESTLGSVWVAGGGSLARVDPGSDRLTNVFPLSSPAAGLSTSRQRLWLLEGSTALALDRVGHLRRRLALPFAAARIAVSKGRLWAIDNCGCAIGQLTAMDLRTGRRIATWAVGATPVALAADGDQVWVASFGNSTLLRVRL